MVKDAQWAQENEEVNENGEVIIVDEEHEDVNALQEEMKYIHIFFDKKFQCAGKDDNHKIMLKQRKKTSLCFRS